MPVGFDDVEVYRDGTVTLLPRLGATSVFVRSVSGIVLAKLRRNAA